MKVCIILEDIEGGISCNMEWDGDKSVNIMDSTPALLMANSALGYIAENAEAAQLCLYELQQEYLANQAQNN